MVITNDGRTTMTTTPFQGARKMKPTLKHVPVMWENMLGTVFAREPKPSAKAHYLDYDWEAARRLADVRPERDPRIFRAPQSMQVGGEYISKGQLVLYVLKEMK
jgi:hypothetical protein